MSAPRPDRPRFGAREPVYRNRFQTIYRVEADFGAFRKELFVNASGVRAGIVVEGPEGILLTRQYRYLIGRLSLEIPGGRIAEGESPLDGAVRETYEETGVRCRELRALIHYQVGLDTYENPTHLFWTDAFNAGDGAAPDGRETVEVLWLPHARCLAAIAGGEIADSFTIIALLARHAQHGGVLP